ncbi:hypothetical protein WH47_09651 [Habropoda laboriosa]|uniref:Uncharacterized protein n=1 Tax=Habropoda laboriosa TaxID=597456 RepID=A0A0L7RE39_9HYME|nr:hypothetical protein WH47_09651 [Habropoda laboriosa]
MNTITRATVLFAVCCTVFTGVFGHDGKPVEDLLRDIFIPERIVLDSLNTMERIAKNLGKLMEDIGKGSFPIDPLSNLKNIVQQLEPVNSHIAEHPRHVEKEGRDHDPKIGRRSEVDVDVKGVPDSVKDSDSILNIGRRSTVDVDVRKRGPVSVKHSEPILNIGRRSTVDVDVKKGVPVSVRVSDPVPKIDRRSTVDVDVRKRGPVSVKHSDPILKIVRRSAVDVGVKEGVPLSVQVSK